GDRVAGDDVAVSAGPEPEADTVAERPASPVESDPVALDDVTCRVRPLDRDAVLAVAGHKVPGGRARPADRRPGRPVEEDSDEVRQRDGAAGVRPDRVALDERAGRAADRDPGAVRGHDVARLAARAADNRAARPGDDRDPAAAVPEWCRTGCVGADEVALDDVPDGIRAGDDDPLQPVAGDHVAGGGARAADRVPACLEDPDAGPVLASRAAADQVPLDEVPGRAGVGEVDAVVRVAIDDVARPGGAAADDVRGGAARDRDAVAAPADVVALDGVRRGSG